MVILMQTILLTALLISGLVLTSGNAGAITLFSGTLNADAAQSAPLGITPSLDGPGGFGGGTIEGDVLVTAPADGTLAISVTDQGLPGNVYEVIFDGASLGTTAPVAVGTGVNSTGMFFVPVAAGSTHDIGLWDFVLTYLGQASPYGGLVDDSTFDAPQPILLTASEDITPPVSPISEPCSGCLLFLAVIAVPLIQRFATSLCRNSEVV